jgi:hypothetical protein
MTIALFMNRDSHVQSGDAMKAYLLNSTTTNRKTTAYRAIRWMALDAAIGAACAALFGIVFGVFGLLLNAESWSVMSVAGYFALCGAAAGAVVGTCVMVLNGDDLPEHANLSAGSTVSTLPTVATCVIDPTSTSARSSHRLRHNRLIASDSRGQTSCESMNPSRN